MQSLQTPVRIDVQDMRRRLGGNDALVAELCQLFLEIHAAQLAAIHHAIAGGEPEAVRRSAHMLKSGASNLSAAALVSAAGALEQAAERGESSAFDPLFANLTSEVAQLVAELRQLQRGHS